MLLFIHQNPNYGFQKTLEFVYQVPQYFKLLALILPVYVEDFMHQTEAALINCCTMNMVTIKVFLFLFGIKYNNKKLKYIFCIKLSEKTY